MPACTIKMLLAFGLVASATSTNPAFALATQDDPPAASTADHAADIAASDDGDGDGLFVDPEPGPDNPNDEPAPRVEGEDLPIGNTMEVEADQGTFRFHADGPGMLTLLAYAPGDRTRVQLQIKDANGRLIPGGMVNGNVDPNNFGARIVVDQFGNPQGSLPGLAYVTVPIGEEGDYQIELNITGEHEDPAKIGGSWVSFEQLAAPPQPVPGVPAVPVPPPPAFDPTDVAQELAQGDTAQVEIDADTSNGWVKLTADDAGTLVVVTNTDSADVRLAVFADGQFNDYIEYVDDDRQGNTGREALMFHSDAGDTWYIRVTARGAQTVPLRTTLIPDDLELADPQDDDE